ncbi:MAG: DNA translocase FtsK 4TM domain-containing protein [Planctomycetes bacterium]|nr:DNA translocase FtsK 4TM domain-containing protein [Planctomycetota bacterium]
MRREVKTRRLNLNRPRIDWREKAREAVGLGIVCFAAFAVVSLLSFDPRDSASIEWSALQSPVWNKGGRLGAAVAESLFSAFGVTAYVAVALVAFWGMMIYLRRSLKDASAKAVGVLLFQAGCSALAALETSPAFLAGDFARGALLRSMGGSYGDLGRDVLVAYFGVVGSYLVLLLLLSLSCLLATDWLVYLLLLRAWTLFRQVAWVLGGVAEAMLDAVSAVRRAREAERLAMAGAGAAGTGAVVGAGGGFGAGLLEFLLGGARGRGGHALLLQPIGLARRRSTQVFAGVPDPAGDSAAPSSAPAGPAPLQAGARASAPGTDVRRGPQGTRIVEPDDPAEASDSAGDAGSGVDFEPAASAYGFPGLGRTATLSPPTDAYELVADEAAAAKRAERGARSVASDDAAQPSPSCGAPRLREPKTEVDLAFGGPAPVLEAGNADEVELERATDALPANSPAPAGAWRAEERESSRPSGAGAADGKGGLPALPPAGAPVSSDGSAVDAARLAAPPPPAASATTASARREPEERHGSRTPPARPLPPTTLLEAVEPARFADIEQEAQHYSAVIETTLKTFGIDAQVTFFERGPVITRYELLLSPGVKVAKILGLNDDLTINLKVPSVRIVYPIPGKNTIGIEVPNAIRETVRLRDLMETCRPASEKMGIPLFFGKDAAGASLVTDLADMPHILVSGTTGAGKSVCLNTLIVSLLLTRPPEDLRMILIDPKTTELAFFQDIPHLMAPVVTDMKRAAGVLEWVIRQMEERYELFSRVGVKKIDSFNQLGAAKIKERFTEPGEEPPDIPTHMPYIVVIVDELADLMMVAGKEVEIAVTRIAQKARAAGIHLVLATQRPSVDVITGLIRANMPARVAFKVVGKIDSKIILGHHGAERLLGRGDMLVLLNGMSDPIRAQCTYVSDNEIRDVVDHLRQYGPPVFDPELLGVSETAAPTEVGDDEHFEDAVRLILEAQRGSISLLQRKLQVGFARAGKLMDMMYRAGVVGPENGPKSREVLLTLAEWDARNVSRAEGGGGV